MTKQEYEYFLTHCKRCKTYCRSNCPWLCISNDTCNGEFFEEEYGESENADDNKSP